MTTQQNKDFVRNHFEQFVNQKNLEIAEKNFAVDFLDHEQPSGLPGGRLGAKQFMADTYKKYPDLHVTIEDMVAENDKVWVRNTWRGTDSATGKKIVFTGVVIWRLANGIFVERWALMQPPHESH